MKTITWTFIIALVIGVMMLSGCSATNTARMIKNGSYSGAGLEERLTNCLVDALDPSNRGSGCHR